MSGSLASLTPDQQIEAIYIAYYGRGADVGGDVYWLNRFAALTSAPDNLTVQQAAVNISESFGTSLQAETVANYAFFQAPPTIPIPDPANPPPAVAASIDAFLTSVYQDLFNRAPDAGGEAYWSQQILSGAVTVGASVYDIANGAAVGSADANVLAYKVEAATYFTSATGAANLGTTSPLSKSFLDAAQTSVATVVDAATEAASQAATDAFINPPPPPVEPYSVIHLTTSIDLPPATTGAAGNDLYIATPSNNGGTTVLLNELNSGDTLTGSSGGANVLNATLTDDSTLVPTIVTFTNWLDGSNENTGYSGSGGFNGNSQYSFNSHVYSYYHDNATSPDLYGYFVRPNLTNIETFNLLATQQETSGVTYFDATIDLSGSQPTAISKGVTTINVVASPFVDSTWLNSSYVTTVTLGGLYSTESADWAGYTLPAELVPIDATGTQFQSLNDPSSTNSTIYLDPNGGPENPDPANVPLGVTTASILNSSNAGIVFGFETSDGTQYGVGSQDLTLNVYNDAQTSPSTANSARQFFDIFGYSYDEPATLGPATINLNLQSSNLGQLVPRPGSAPTSVIGSASPGEPLQQQIDPSNLWLYDHAVTQFSKPILTTLNLDSIGNFEVIIPEFYTDSSVVDRNTFLDATKITIIGGAAVGGVDGTVTAGELDLTNDTFGAGSSYTGGGFGPSNQGGFQHFRQVVTLDAHTYTGNLDINIGANDFSSQTANGLASIALGSGNNHLDLINEYSTGHYTVTTGNGDNVVLFGADNLTAAVTLTGGTGDNTLGVTNGDELNNSDTANVTGFDTLEIVGAIKYSGEFSGHFGSAVNDYNLGGLPGGSVFGNYTFQAVTLTAYYDPNFYFAGDKGTTGTSSNPWNGAFNGGGSANTDYVIDACVALWDAPLVLPFTFTNYADDSTAHRLSTGQNPIFLQLASSNYDTGVLDLNFHNIDYNNDAQASSKYFWQFIYQLVLDDSAAIWGDEGHSYGTVNINADTTLAANNAAPTTYVDEIYKLNDGLGTDGVSTITVTGNATLWLDNLDQTKPLTLVDAHTSTGNIGANYHAGVSAALGGAAISQTYTGGANLGYFDLNHFFNGGSSITFESSQGLNFVQVEGTNRQDTFDLLGGNNQIVVDNHHIGTSGDYDLFNFYNNGSAALSNLFGSATLPTNSVPHISGKDGNGHITLSNSDSTLDTTPNTGAATIYGFEAGPSFNSNGDQITLNFTKPDGTGAIPAAGTGGILDLTNANVISTTSDLTNVAGLFNGAGNTHYDVAEFKVNSHDVFVFVDTAYATSNGDFHANTDLVIHLVNNAQDIQLGIGNFHFA